MRGQFRKASVNTFKALRIHQQFKSRFNALFWLCAHLTPVPLHAPLELTAGCTFALALPP